MNILYNDLESTSVVKKKAYETHPIPKTLLLAIHAPYNRTRLINTYFEEFQNLVKSDGIPFEIMHVVKLREIDSSYFLTKGKLEEVLELCKKHDIEQVILSESVSPQQARNLEDYLQCSLMDRTDLILDIFEKAALSAEGKTQVQIALLQHKKTRLAGKGIHLEQQVGVTGLRGGPGEKAKERERRHIDQLILRLNRELKELQKSRSVQRKQRLSRNIPHICLIGYTNTGKSTLLNTLTHSDVLAENKLFATLDTTTRALFIDGKQKGVISDTVGFIQHLPHHLIEAFKSTLSELQYADLLLHVIDVSNPDWPHHITVVNAILNELGIEKDILYVFNKADKVENLDEVQTSIAQYQPHVLVSAKKKEHLKPLISYLHNWNPSPK